jgi:hypothetical protein
MIPKLIKTYNDLVTSHDAIKRGFTVQAIAKTEKSAPYIERALEFSLAIKDVKSVEELLELKKFRKEILGAAGFSDKAVSHFTEEEIEESIRIVLDRVFNNEISVVRNELVYRYLLTKGDTLGGSMRNYVGASANTKLIGFLTSALEKKKN